MCETGLFVASERPYAPRMLSLEPVAGTCLASELALRQLAAGIGVFCDWCFAGS